MGEVGQKGCLASEGGGPGKKLEKTPPAKPTKKSVLERFCPIAIAVGRGKLKKRFSFDAGARVSHRRVFWVKDYIACQRGEKQGNSKLQDGSLE